MSLSSPRSAEVIKARRLERARKRRRARLRRAVALGVLAVAVAGGAWWYSTSSEVIPGVAVAGVDVGGLSKSEARAQLETQLGAALAKPITINGAAGTSARVAPSDLGIRVNVQATLDRAWSTGRVAGVLMPLVYSASVQPVLLNPARSKLPAALARTEQAPKNARPIIHPDGSISVVPSENGIGYARPEAAAAIAAAAFAGQTQVSLVPAVEQPQVSTEAAQQSADRAKAMLSGPVSVRVAGKTIQTITPAQLAAVLTVKRTLHGYRPVVDPTRVEPLLAAAAKPYTWPARDAHFATDGTRARVVPEKSGVGIDASRTAVSLTRAADRSGSSRAAKVFFGRSSAAFTAAQARRLGIREAVSSATISMGSSSPNRIANVELMAKIVDGTIVKPGETFSFNGVVGPRTAARGFLEGQAIVGGVLVPSIGGGVCQAATTLFNAAFAGGYTINERTNHEFYINHYPLGMDATVSWGGPDFKFTNDSKYGILIRMTASSSYSYATFYSTSRGLKVTSQTSPQTSPTTPGKRYFLDPALGAGISQITQGEPGFSVTVTRTIADKSGKVIKTDSFPSRYIPEDVMFSVGPKWKAPKGAGVKVEPPIPTTG